MVTTPLSSRRVRRAASEAVSAVQSLGAVVNGNAELLKQHMALLFELQKSHRLHMMRVASVPSAHSTLWQRLRWLIRGT